MKFILFCFLYAFTLSSYSQQKSYSFVFLHKKSDAESLPKEQLDKIMQGHMANIERLAKEGKLIVAGPFENGGGIFILNTTSLDEADQWLSTDPGVQARRWNIEILPYTPRIGSVCIAKEPYEMVTYHFIRFSPTAKAKNENVSAHLKQHQEYIRGLEEGNVITEGSFETGGNILILKGDLKNAIPESDPGVQGGFLSVDIKKLWIARGSFCEK